MNKKINNPGFRALPQSVQQNILSNMKYGGRMYNAGGMLDEYNEGGTHEENPLGGIPVGKNARVEEGETRFGDYIFSNRLEITKDLVAEFNLPKKYVGKTFADVSKSIQKPNSRRTDDTLEMANVEKNLTKLQEAQEMFKQSEIERKLQEINELDPNVLAAMSGQGMAPQDPNQGMDPSMMDPAMMDPNMMMQQGQPSPEEMAMMQQGQPQGQPSEEEMMMMQQMAMQQQGAPQGMPPGMGAYGGPLSNIAFGHGGRMYNMGGFYNNPEPPPVDYTQYQYPADAQFATEYPSKDAAQEALLNSSDLSRAYYKNPSTNYMGEVIGDNDMSTQINSMTGQPFMQSWSPDKAKKIARYNEVLMPNNAYGGNLPTQYGMGGRCYGCGGKMYATGGEFVPGKGMVLSTEGKDNLVGASIAGGLKGVASAIPGVGGYVSQGIDSVYGMIDPNQSNKERQFSAAADGITGIAANAITGNIPGLVTNTADSANTFIQNTDSINEDIKKASGIVNNLASLASPLMGQGNPLGANTPINVADGTQYIDGLPSDFGYGGRMYNMGGTMKRGLSDYYDVDGMGGYLGDRRFFVNGGDLTDPPANKYLVRSTPDPTTNMIEDVYRIGKNQIVIARREEDAPLTESDVIAKYKEIVGEDFVPTSTNIPLDEIGSSTFKDVNISDDEVTSQSVNTPIVDTPKGAYQNIMNMMEGTSGFTSPNQVASGISKDVDVPNDTRIVDIDFDSLPDAIDDSEIPELNTGENLTEEEKQTARENYAKKQALEMGKLNLKYKESPLAFAASMASPAYNFYQGLTPADQINLRDIYAGDINPQFVDYSASINTAKDLGAGATKGLKEKAQGSTYLANLGKLSQGVTGEINKIETAEENANKKIKYETDKINKENKSKALAEVTKYNKLAKAAKAAHIAEGIKGINDKMTADQKNKFDLEKLKAFAPDIVGDLEYSTVLGKLSKYMEDMLKKK